LRFKVYAIFYIFYTLSVNGFVFQVKQPEISFRFSPGYPELSDPRTQNQILSGFIPVVSLLLQLEKIQETA
jgi:hypothetical protein